MLSYSTIYVHPVNLARDVKAVISNCSGAGAHLFKSWATFLNRSIILTPEVHISLLSLQDTLNTKEDTALLQIEFSAVGCMQSYKESCSESLRFIACKVEVIQSARFDQCRRTVACVVTIKYMLIQLALNVQIVKHQNLEETLMLSSARENQLILNSTALLVKKES